jgi:hypothetical protein
MFHVKHSDAQPLGRCGGQEVYSNPRGRYHPVASRHPSKEGNFVRGLFPLLGGVPRRGGVVVHLPIDWRMNSLC